MPLRGNNPVCLKCETEESPLWTNAENLGAICLQCINEAKEETKSDDEGESRPAKRKTRATRSYKTRLNPLALPKTVLPKGKGRRVIFKKTPTKAPTAVATPVTSDSIYYKGMYYQKGDVVSMIDEDGDHYYAQIRGFLTDQYCEKSAVVTWLLPTQESPPPAECFDPATYIIGPEEEVPRKLECMEFIMHAPSDYYKTKNSPYPMVYPTPEPGFIWTRLEPIQRLITDTTDTSEKE
ncbi:PREDICTED: GATA zinc finger domain-containing protein 1 [Nicrophorus vespilloides]|uniref:GATA zinc finger domain-containing protein 1 n=1 Tax=Nicrophorus vespilloides TaxID=110193 RepID=A0ABM1M667_NICVS|nr:PREDICTED: GATA zinc finger domain-containing protein 1 [Nicrophorus vespilloides]